MEVQAKVLVIEDGDDYIEALIRYGGGRLKYVAAQSCNEAVHLIRSTGQDFAAMLLDLSFDKTPEELLVTPVDRQFLLYPGEPEEVLQRRRQGLLILERLYCEMHRHCPVLIAHDFQFEAALWSYVVSKFRSVRYVPDDATPQEMESALLRMIGQPQKVG